MNYWETIEGTLESTDENIEDNLKKIESRTETRALDDDIDAKLSEMSEEEIIDLAKKYIESLNTLVELQNIGEDVSEGFKIAIERLSNCLNYITDVNIKKTILESAKNELKKTNYANTLDFQSSKSR